MSTFPSPDRRNFLKTGALLSAASLLPQLGSAAEDAKPIKIALVGCGGRGTGAAAQSLAVAGTVLVAMADAFADNLASAHKQLSEKKAAAKEKSSAKRKARDEQESTPVLKTKQDDDANKNKKKKLSNTTETTTSSSGGVQIEQLKQKMIKAGPKGTAQTKVSDFVN